MPEDQKDNLKKQQKENASDTTSFSDQEKKVNARIKHAIGDEPVKAFSRRSGIPETSLRDYISGKKKPGLDAITLISEFTGTTVDWLATGKGIKSTIDLQHAEERLKGNPPAVFSELPEVLEPCRERLDALLNYLVMIDDEKERKAILDDFISRAKKIIEMSELKQTVNELRATYQKHKTNN